MSDNTIQPLIDALRLARSHIDWCWDVIEAQPGMRWRRDGSANIHQGIDDAIVLGESALLATDQPELPFAAEEVSTSTPAMKKAVAQALIDGLPSGTTFHPDGRIELPAEENDNSAAVIAAAIEALIDGRAMLSHYAEGRPRNWDGSTAAQARTVIVAMTKALGLLRGSQ